MKANEDLRTTAKAAGIPLWRVGDALKISEPTMTRRLRKELPAHEKVRIITIIRQLSEVNRKGGR